MGRLFMSKASYERKSIMEKIYNLPETANILLFIGDNNIIFTYCSVSNFSNVNIVYSEYEIPFIAKKTDIFTKSSFLNILQFEDDAYLQAKMIYSDNQIDISNQYWIDEIDDIDKYFHIKTLNL